MPQIPAKKTQLIERLYSQKSPILPITEIAQRAKVPYITALLLTSLKEEGIVSYSDYRDDLAKRNGHASYYHYKQFLVGKNGYKSYSDYQKQLGKQRQKWRANKELSGLIKSRLNEMGKDQSWLAEKLDSSRQLTSLYANGKIFPPVYRFKKIISVLQVPDEILAKYKTLDSLLEKYP